MKEIMFLIEDDPEGGYNAQALRYSIFTEGETVEEIKENIMDALRCHFDNAQDIPRAQNPNQSGIIPEYLSVPYPV